MLPDIDNPCFGYVCGVPDGTIPGVTISDCETQGYSGVLAGCVDPRCVGWRPNIPGCGPQAYNSLSRQDYPTSDPFSGLLAGDMIFDGTGRTGGGGCGCAPGANPAGFPPGLGGPVTPDNVAVDTSGSCCGGRSLFGFPWWVLVLLLILIFKGKL